MSAWTFALGVIASAGLTAHVLGLRDRRRAAAEYAAKVGLDLAGLVALLPVDLRRLPFTRFHVQHTHEPGVLHVGLFYAIEGLVHRGPPRVVLEFDATTGALLRIDPGSAALDLSRLPPP